MGPQNPMISRVHSLSFQPIQNIFLCYCFTMCNAHIYVACFQPFFRDLNSNPGDSISSRSRKFLWFERDDSDASWVVLRIIYKLHSNNMTKKYLHVARVHNNWTCACGNNVYPLPQLHHSDALISLFRNSYLDPILGSLDKFLASQPDSH